MIVPSGRRQTTPAPRSRPDVVRPTVRLCVACALAAAATVAGGQPAKLPASSVPERIPLQTSDAHDLTAWHYAIAEDATPLATVILIHDLGGSHATVEPLAKQLRAAGCTVVAPDLRGHSAGRETARALKSADFEMMAASRGGQKRDQAAVRGDVECVHGWIQAETAAGRLRAAPLVVVGSGLGAAIAVRWAVADAAWPDLATGSQGRTVRGLVLIGPTFTTRGFTIGQTLAMEPVGRSLPVLVLSGADDRDAARVFDLLKRQRPRGYFDGREPAGQAASGATPTLFLVELEARLGGDALAAHRPTDPESSPAKLITGFVKTALPAAARE